MFFCKGHDEIQQPCHDSSPSFFWFRKGNDEIPQVLLGRGLQTQHLPSPLFFWAQLDLAGPSTATSTVAPMRGPAQQLFSFGPVTAPGFSTPCLNLPRPSSKTIFVPARLSQGNRFFFARSLLPGFTDRGPTPLLHMATNIQNLN